MNFCLSLLFLLSSTTLFAGYRECKDSTEVVELLSLYDRSYKAYIDLNILI